MSTTPPEGPDRDGSATAAPAFDCPACGRLRIRVDRPGNLVEYVCPECSPEALPRELTGLDPT